MECVIFEFWFCMREYYSEVSPTHEIFLVYFSKTDKLSLNQSLFAFRACVEGKLFLDFSFLQFDSLGADLPTVQMIGPFGLSFHQLTGQLPGSI